MPILVEIASRRREVPILLGSIVMSNAIGSAGGSSSMMMGGMNGMRRSGSLKMADDLFSKLDTKGHSYIEKRDIQSAFNQVSSKNPSGNSASVDDVFKALDGDGDGKVTKQEMSDSVKKLADQLDSQFQNKRMGMGGGMTKSDIPGMADSAGGSAQRMDALLANFDTADTDQDGKISAQETLAFQDSAKAAASSSDKQGNDAKIMQQIMELAKSYGESSQNSSTISIAA